MYNLNMEKFIFFWGNKCENGVFSNWYYSPFVLDGVKYTCVEQYMMSEKAHLFGDEEVFAKIMATGDPREQKALGRAVKGFDKEKWEQVAQDIVYKACYAKFTQNPELEKALMATGDTILVEASPRDPIWGIGLAGNDPRALNRSTWKGLNWLGEILTRVREDIKVFRAMDAQKDE
jgi:ribA/ribD-fused uncharacterized protein